MINPVAATFYGSKDPTILTGRNYFDLLITLKLEPPISSVDLTKNGSGKVVERKRTTILLKEQQHTIEWSLSNLVSNNRTHAYVLAGKDVGEKIGGLPQTKGEIKGSSLLLNEQKVPDNKNRILIVEDQSVGAVVVQNMLNNLGCDVDVAPNGQTALELVKQYLYDLIFMDIGLPDMDGYEVTKAIRKYESNSEHKVPIVALTAHASPESKQFCLDIGMNAALTKPLLEDTAVDVLKAFIPSRGSASKVVPSAQEVKSGIFTTTGKIVDFEVAKKATGMNNEAVEAFLNMFVENILRDEVILDRAFYRGDWEKIEEIIHKLRGSCDYCGAIKLKEVCIRLEDYITSKKIELRETLYNQVREEMQALKWYVKSTVNKK